MTIQEFADKLNGRQYGQELTKQEEKLAKKLGYLVIFGAGDDLIEFHGVFVDEVGAFDGNEIVFGKKGLPESECHEGYDCPYFSKQLESGLKRKAFIKVTAYWSGKYDDKKHPDYDNVKDISWTFQTDVPHATFDIMEEGEVYCRGIVIDLEGL